MTAFHSTFAERFAGYVRLRRGLGLKLAEQERLLRAIDRFLSARF